MADKYFFIGKQILVGKKIAKDLFYIFVYNFQPILFIVLVCTKFDDVAVYTFL